MKSDCATIVCPCELSPDAWAQFTEVDSLDMCTGPLQILVIGKMKTGKSLLANNIIGEYRFKVGSTWFRPVTKAPEEHTAKISGRDVKVCPPL